MQRIGAIGIAILAVLLCLMRVCQKLLELVAAASNLSRAVDVDFSATSDYAIDVAYYLLVWLIDAILSCLSNSLVSASLFNMSRWTCVLWLFLELFQILVIFHLNILCRNQWALCYLFCIWTWIWRCELAFKIIKSGERGHTNCMS